MIAPYSRIEFEPSREDRPVVFINMVSTIDGKTVVGTRDDDVYGLGSDLDLQALRHLDAASDAVLIGAQTLRAMPKTWRPKARISLVATRSGNLPRDARFFEGESYVISLNEGDYPAPRFDLGSSTSDRGSVHWPDVLSKLRLMGVERLYVLGGSELNADLLKADAVDELFLTIAPKIKLGTDLPTYAGGEALPREALMEFELLESHVLGDEAFLRYRRRKD